MRTLAVLLLLSTCALAAPPDPATVQAKELFTHAESLYALTRYAEALAEYEKAFEIKPLPGFLFNIGQCHRMLGHWEKAAYFYRTYLDRAPDARNRELVKSLIAEMDDKAKAQPPDKRVNPDPLAPPPTEPPPKATPPGADLSKPIERPPWHRRWYVWAGAAAAAVIVVAVVLGVTLSARAPSGSLDTVDAR